MASRVDFPQPVPGTFEVSPETSAELKTIRAALLDWRFWLKAALIVAAPLWIYRPVLHGQWLMDDGFYLAKNALMSDPHRLWKAWFEPGSFIEYYPIQESLQWAQWRLWGENTFGYHLTNVLFHAFSSLLIWRLLGKFQLSWAWLGGLLFAIHPALVESVAWVAELKNTLSLPPFLIAMCCYIEYENKGRPRDYWFAVAAFVIAMLCKISMAPFPAAILLYGWWRRGRIGWKDLRASAPFWVISVALVVLSGWCGMTYAGAYHMETPFATGEGLPFRIALIGQAFSFYFAICIWPFGLLPMYFRWPLEHPALIQFLPWPIMLSAAWWFWVNRATWGRHALLGFGFFLMFVAPFLGFFIISYMRLTWVMDHFVYISIIGIIGLAVAWCEWQSSRLSFTASALLKLAVAFVVVIFALSSHGYAKKFVDQRTLWTFTIKKNPKAFTAYNNLGGIVLTDGDNPRALKLFDQALKYYPDYFEAHYNRGLTLDRLERHPEAQEEYRKAVALGPQSLDARMMYGQSLQASGDYFEAIRQMETIAAEEPRMSEVHAILGSLYTRIGKTPDAARAFTNVIHLDPTAAGPHNDLGNALYLMGHKKEAMDEYREAVKLDPTLVEAHNNLGGALEESGHLDEAIEEFKMAVQLDPTNPKPNTNLADALVKAGHPQEAIEHYKTALWYDPGNPDALAGLQALHGPASAKSPAK